MSFALILIIAGLVIGFGALGFAASNMLCDMRTNGLNPFSAAPDWKKFIGAMIIMIFGGLLFVIGLILEIANIINRVIP